MTDRTFIIDSRDLESVQSRLYGYMIGMDEEIYVDEVPPAPSDIGLFVMIQRSADSIRISQDFLGSFGLYIYQCDSFFRISNSFFRLAESLKGMLTPNDDAIKDVLYATDVPLVLDDTMAVEIRKLESLDSIIIDLSSGSYRTCRKSLDYFKIDPKSQSEFDILDDWYNKWVRILRNLVRRNVPVITDISGGLDTRLILSMFINGNVDISGSMVARSNKPLNDKDTEDRAIGEKIAAKYGFNLNEGLDIDHHGELPASEIYEACKYTSFGRTLMCRYNDISYDQPVFALKGLASMTKGGGMIIDDGEGEGRLNKFTGYQLMSYETAHKGELKPENIEFFKRYLHNKRIITQMLDQYDNRSEYHQATYIDQKTIIEGRDALKALDWMNGNLFIISPFLDPVIAQFDYDPGENDNLYLNTLLFYRYSPELAVFPIQGGRSFKPETIERVKKLNSMFPPRIDDHPDRIAGTRFHASARKWDEDELFAYLYDICSSDKFKAVKERYMDPLGANKAELLPPDMISTINEGAHKINAWLAVYEFSQIIEEGKGSC